MRKRVKRAADPDFDLAWCCDAELDLLDRLTRESLRGLG